MASVAKTKATWSDERRQAFRELIRAINPMGNPATRQKMAAAKTGKKIRLGKRFVLSEQERRHRDALAAKRRRGLNVRVRIADTISAQIRHALKGNKAGRRWESLVGYTVHALAAHLKTTLPAGFMWDDYVSGNLEIDHIRPVCAHDLSQSSAIKQCWALTNLRLLTPDENNRKNGRLLAAAS